MEQFLSDFQFVSPTLKDVDDMLIMVLDEVKSGVILPRTKDEIATNIRSYIIIKQDENIVGYGALHIYSSTLAEIRSLIIKDGFRGHKLGFKLVNRLLDNAKELELKDIFVLTYKKNFFERLEFKEIDKKDLPDQKIWADCIKCKHFPICDEIALIYKI